MRWSAHLLIQVLGIDRIRGRVRRQVVLTGTALIAAAGSAFGQERCDAVGPHRIHTCVYAGEGPTLVLAAGAGQDSRTWSPLLEPLRALGSVVTFDRPGLGRSPEVSGPRTPTLIARELRAALDELGVSGPVVLIGHSMGGVHALRYADLFPDDVAAVVLLDTPPPGFERDRLELLSAQEREDRRRALAEGRSRAAAVVGRERDGAAAERWAFDRFPAEVPLLVVVADHQDFGEVGSVEAHRDLWVRQSSQWLEMSMRAELVVAGGSGHMVHHDRPQLVVDAVARLVDRPN
jgi:pimeloyl-ACP methyl ester carboxylesterase